MPSRINLFAQIFYFSQSAVYHNNISISHDHISLLYAIDFDLPTKYHVQFFGCYRAMHGHSSSNPIYT
jgi:hypothetical protein